MKLAKNINMDKIIKSMKEFSGADIKAVCTEAGYFAIRKNRHVIKEADILKAIEKVKEGREEDDGHIGMFG